MAVLRIAGPSPDSTVRLAESMALSPAATLARGYAIVQDAEGAVVRNPADVAVGDRVEMTFRRLYTVDGIHNYFWKARPVRGA